MNLDTSELKSVTQVAEKIKYQYRFMVEANQDWAQAVEQRRNFIHKHGFNAIRKNDELNTLYERLGNQIETTNTRISRIAECIDTLFWVLGVKRSVF